MGCRIVFRAVALVLIFAALPFGAAWAQQYREVPVSKEQVQLSYAPIVKKTAPAVVNIYTRKVVSQRVLSPFLNDPFFQQFFEGRLSQGMNRKRLENSLGSGVIVRPDGLIVTSNHVIDGADEITVVLSDRREFEAEVVSSDERSDLALLRIISKDERFHYIELKDSDEAEVGDIVIAIGNPFGVGQTVTSGIVSAIARTNLDLNDINYYIQTDAAINPGNSGGALVSMDGRLLGINTAIYSKSGGSMGLGFAIPSNMVRATIDSVAMGQGAQRKGLVRPWTGIEGQTVTAELAASLGMPRPGGLIIKAIHPASPALKIGIKVGDVLTSVNGKEVADPAAFSYRIATMPIGSEVELGIVRAGQPQAAKLMLISPPEVPARDETIIKGKNPLAGAKIANLSPAVSQEYGLHGAEKGVVILGLQKENRLISGLGLGRGDVILSINGKEIQTVKEATEALSLGTTMWRISINRGGEIMNLIVR